MSSIEIIPTGDGSHSLLNKELNETYHSRHGAVQESNHVFLKNGLDFFCERISKNPIHVFEVGFGTGLNAWLTGLRSVEIGRRICYTSLETYPLPEDLWQQLNYASGGSNEKELFTKIHEAEWGTDVQLLPTFSLKKVNQEVQQFQFEPGSVDVVFFDAFAPNKQPELWAVNVLEKVANAMSAGSVFVTYCAKGQLKRDLKALNLEVETLAGPPGKKEMVRALKI